MDESFGHTTPVVAACLRGQAAPALSVSSVFVGRVSPYLTGFGLLMIKRRKSQQASLVCASYSLRTYRQ